VEYDGHGLDEENKMKDYAFWRQFSKKPKIIPGCPVNDAFAYNVMTQHLAYWTCSSSPWPIKICAGDVADAKHQLLSCALLMVDLSTFVLSCRLPSGLYQAVV